MEINFSKIADTLVIQVSGRLDGKTVDAFDQQVEALLVTKPNSVSVDLSNLQYISSVGISALLKIAKRLKTHGASLGLHGAFGEVKKILGVSGLIARFPDKAKGQESPVSEVSAAAVVGNRDVFEVSVRDNALQKAQDFVGGFAGKVGLNAEQMGNLELVVEEIVTNIVRCAYADGEGKMSIVCVDGATSLSLTFIDAGQEFNPLLRAEPDINCPIEDRQIGGLGIFLVKKLAQKVEYNRENNQNRLTVWMSK